MKRSVGPAPSVHILPRLVESVFVSLATPATQLYKRSLAVLPTVCVMLGTLQRWKLWRYFCLAQGGCSMPSLFSTNLLRPNACHSSWLIACFLFIVCCCLCCVVAFASGMGLWMATAIPVKSASPPTTKASLPTTLCLSRGLPSQTLSLHAHTGTLKPMTSNPRQLVDSSSQ
jgi:hypothetical protein